MCKKICMEELWICTKWFREWEHLAGIKEKVNLIPLARVNSLDEEEQVILLYCLNILYPSKLLGEVSLSIVPYYKKEALQDVLANICRPQIKEEKMPVFESLMKKLFDKNPPPQNQH